MKTLIQIIYFGVIPVAIYSDFCENSSFLREIGGFEAISNLILIFYCVQFRKSKFIHRDWLLLEALLFTCACGSLLLLFQESELLMFINTIGFYLTQFVYINIFRNEGSILPPFNTVFREWKMLILTTLFLIGLVFLIVRFIPTTLLVLSFIYSTQMMLLCWMAYYRPIAKKEYIEGLVGVFILVMSNLWLTINLFYNTFPYKISSYFFLYAVSQFLIVQSILRNNSKSSKTSNSPLDSLL
ncbi:hypothetical protein EMA8858_01940 [Emticicia aquatica]|uniref:YhhN-like protein n=1 Tax=Emticicia aquatica TaxID=1681835 RepID=A0ABN8EVH7_9BACT|nr:lysoplasmalogenase family protein [Emticicia aquatica]CAH0995813.1 hypothetical protein EMA8858_01940 [Emticicia aquatica]